MGVAVEEAAAGPADPMCGPAPPAVSSPVGIYLPACFWEDWRLRGSSCWVPAHSEQIISAHLVPREAVRDVTCFTLKRRRRPGETDFSTHSGEVLPENSMEACEVRLLARAAPEPRVQMCPYQAFLDRLSTKLHPS